MLINFNKFYKIKKLINYKILKNSKPVNLCQEIAVAKIKMKTQTPKFV